MKNKKLALVVLVVVFSLVTSVAFAALSRPLVRRNRYSYGPYARIIDCNWWFVEGETNLIVVETGSRELRIDGRDVNWYECMDVHERVAEKEEALIPAHQTVVIRLNGRGEDKYYYRRPPRW